MEEATITGNVDIERANAARIYDFFLGGAQNFAVDREQGEKILARNPDMAQVCRANRDYLGRVVRWCLAQGVDQFLDLGSGVPTVGNVHEIAQHLDPSARVAYIDIEPVAVAHARELVRPLAGVTITQADLRDPTTVLAAPNVVELFDWERPIALLSVAVLHFLADDDLPAVMAAYRDALPAGSVQAVSHGSADQDDAAVADRMRATEEGYRGSASPVHLRSRDEITALMGGRIEPPGLVDIVDWPDPRPDVRRTGAYAAVARVGR